MTTTESHPALNHRCPFCRADPGEACRTRNSGREQPHPHTRRLALTRPAVERTAASDVMALCCVCGAQRTVSGNYRRHNDPNYDYGPIGRKEGWRYTQTLKCEACGERTRHAFLRPGDAWWRDSDEKYQRYILGGEWHGEYAPDRERLRAEYFTKFPRNPYLHHWYTVDEAQAAWEAGERTVTALCGDTMTLNREPNLCRGGRGSGTDEPVEPDEVRDMEYEDPETGLWWDDMDCVNCLRVTNERRLKRRRERLESWLAWFACHPEAIPDDDADALNAIFGPLAEAIRQREG